MSNDLYDLIKTYMTKNPTLNFTEIADLIIEDGATTKSHRTLRLYAAEVAAEALLELNGAVVPTALVDMSDETDFIDTGSDGTALEQELPFEYDVVITKKRTPKVLVLDIETARMIVGVWKLGYKEVIGQDQVIKDWFIYGWAAKWLFDAKVMRDFVTPEEATARDDKRICESLWAIVDEADIIITHNGIKFDMPKISTRFFLNGLPPFSSYQNIDTYRIASKQFGFSSNALNYIAQIALHREKVKTTYSLWVECENAVPESLAFMEEYCVADVCLEEEVYLALRPWIKGHPNLGVLVSTEHPVCPNCGGDSFTETGTVYTTQQNAYSEVRCDSCGAVNRTKKSLITTEQRKNMLVPAAH
jgi:DNA polymerase elongation subunit (family B)